MLMARKRRESRDADVVRQADGGDGNDDVCVVRLRYRGRECEMFWWVLD
jgi:hypothetical protein